MTFTAALFIFAGIWTIYGIRRYFDAITGWRKKMRRRIRRRPILVRRSRGE